LKIFLPKKSCQFPQRNLGDRNLISVYNHHKKLFFDFVCVGAKCDHNFARKCWNKLPSILFEKLKFQELSNYLYSNISVNFYAPHHGHNICDSHFGAAKKNLRRKFSPVGTHIQTIEQIVTCFEEIKHTIVVVFDHIENSDIKVTKLIVV